MKKYLGFFAICAISFLMADTAFAQEAHAATGGGDLADLGAALGMGLAAFGGALGFSKILGSALESIGRNPTAAGQMFVPWLLGCVFVEVAVILTFVIAIKLA